MNPIAKILSAGCAVLGVLLLVGTAHAGPYVPAGPFVVPKVGPGIPAPATVPGKEVSTHLPGIFGIGGDRNVTPVADPEQDINWDGTGGTADGADYTGSRAGSVPADTLDREVDALASAGDLFYAAVIGNFSALLFSVDDNPNIYSESIGGGGATWADQGISQLDGTPGSDIDAMTPILDVDGLEVWGAEPTAPDFSAFDANRYSLESPAPLGIPDPLGVSVWDISGGLPAVALWSTADIATIVGLATGIPGLDPTQINLDGMMTEGDSDIMFTIDPILGTVIDGGEIFVGSRVGGPGTAIAGGAFLFHGGHLWNSAFPVAATFGLASENINALESVAVPEPSTMVLAGLGLAVIVGMALRRRKRA